MSEPTRGPSEQWAGESDFDDAYLDVTCPGCNARLTDNSVFETYRLCHECGRHFWLPARERLALIVDPDSFQETNGDIVSVDPLVFENKRTGPDQGYADDSIGNALVTGLAKIGGCHSVVVVADFAMLGDAIGIVAGEKIVLAIETAASKRLPLVVISSDGPSGAGDESVSALQSLRITNALARLHKNGMPCIAVLSHPSTGALFQGLASHADILLAEPGTHIGMSTELAADGKSIAPAPAEAVLAAGSIDGIVSRRSVRTRLTTLLDILTTRVAPRWGADPVASSISQLSATDEQAIARHPGRPGPDDLVERIMPGFVELHGDRVAGDDQGIRIGIAQIDGVSVAVLMYGDCTSAEPDDGHCTAITPTALRKVARLYRLASLVELPVVSFIASGTLAPPEATDGAAMATEMSSLAGISANLTVPSISVIVGETGGLTAFSLAIADRILMLEHAVLTPTRDAVPLPISGAASSSRKRQVMTSRELQRARFVHSIIPEPPGGAHTDPPEAAQEIRLAITHALAELSGIGPRHRRDDRSRNLRELGLSGAISADHVRLELAQLQEIQKVVGQSILDIRDRVESYNRQLPVLLQLPDRPGMPDLSRHGLPELPAIRKPTVTRSELNDLRTRINSKRRNLSHKLSEVKDSKTGKSGESAPVESTVEPVSDSNDEHLAS